MKYMNNNLRVGLNNAKHYRYNSQYKKQHDKVQLLQNDNFITPSLDPDVFLDILDDLVIHNLECDKDDEEWFGNNNIISHLLSENKPSNDAFPANIGTNIEMYTDPYCDLNIFINQNLPLPTRSKMIPFIIYVNHLHHMKNIMYSCQIFLSTTTKKGLVLSMEQQTSTLMISQKQFLATYFDTFTTNIHHHNLSSVLLLQDDSGANQSVTNNIDLLCDISFIAIDQISGIDKGITCTTIEK